MFICIARATYCYLMLLLVLSWYHAPTGVGNVPLRSLSGLPVDSITGGNLMVLKNTGSKTATLCYKWGTLL